MVWGVGREGHDETLRDEVDTSTSATPPPTSISRLHPVAASQSMWKSAHGEARCTVVTIDLRITTYRNATPFEIPCSDTDF